VRLLKVRRTVALPDGRELVVTRSGPLDDWVASIPGGARTAQGRWLLVVVREVLGVSRGRPPELVLDIVDQASGYDTPLGRRYPCPCCDYLTLTAPPTGTYAICPVCRWEDDNAQYSDINYKGGANRVSLREARENYRRYGQKDRKDRSARGTPRPPLPEEHPPR
jgi:hypothetical protein